MVGDSEGGKVVVDVGNVGAEGLRGGDEGRYCEGGGGGGERGGGGGWGSGDERTGGGSYRAISSYRAGGGCDRTTCQAGREGVGDRKQGVSDRREGMNEVVRVGYVRERGI